MKNNIVEMQNNTKEFFNNATHELKTPLTAIRGYSQMLQEEEFEDDDFEDFMEEDFDGEEDFEEGADL